MVKINCKKGIAKKLVSLLESEKYTVRHTSSISLEYVNSKKESVVIFFFEPEVERIMKARGLKQ